MTRQSNNVIKNMENDIKYEVNTEFDFYQIVVFEFKININKIKRRKKELLIRLDSLLDY